MTPTRRVLSALTCLLLGVGLIAAVSVSADAARAPRAKVTLSSVGPRYAGTAIPVVGYLLRAGSKHDKTLYLQHRVGSTWQAAGHLRHRASGKYAFPSKQVYTVGSTSWRVLAKKGKRLLGVSNVLTVKVQANTCASKPSQSTCPKPPDRIQTRDVVNAPTCATNSGTVTTDHQTRHQPYVWNSKTLEWEPGDPLEWVTISTVSRAANSSECPFDLLPDMVVRNLTLCSDAERAKSTNNTCFTVQPFTKQDGTAVTLLKFPGTTFNIGAGAMEVDSTRDNAVQGTVSWHDTSSVQRIYDTLGGHRDVDITDKIDFYWEELPTSGEDNHGHTHWHILDFDSYTDNGAADVQEKHGFCLSSTIANGPSLTGAGALDPAYDSANACGFNNPNAETITHGLSPLYGDTYPSNLEDQGIDITAQVDGVHHIQVCADHNDALLESNEKNNCASADVTVTDGAVVSVANGTGFGH